MIDVPISIMAWAFVVGFQAIVHFFIFGARRERIQESEAAKYETLSVSSRSESFTDADPIEALAAMNCNLHMLDNPAMAVAAASSSSLLYYGDDDEEDEEDDIIIADRTAMNASFPRKSLSVDNEDSLIVEPSPESLMQTGEDILRVSLVSFLLKDCVHCRNSDADGVPHTLPFVALVLFCSDAP